MKPKHIMAGLATLGLALALCGCSESTKKTFGLEANPPDAFDVAVQAPLSLPPELGQLPPPNAGQPRPQQEDAAQEGLYALSPASSLTAQSPAASAGQQALLDTAGPTPPNTIRAQVNQSALIASKPPGFVDSLMGSAPAAEPTVDANAEAKRLQENAALGQPVTAGNTPQYSNQPPSVWERFLSMF